MKRLLPLLLTLFLLCAFSCSSLPQNAETGEEQTSFVTEPETAAQTENGTAPSTQPESLPESLPETEPAFTPVFEALPVDGEVFARIKDTSYHDCPLPLTDLVLLRLSYVDFDGAEQVGEMLCNVHIAQDLLAIFQTLYEARYPIGRIALVDEYGGDDEASMQDNNTSCFNYRTVLGSEKISAHGLGLAVDLNPLYNPYVKVRDEKTTVQPASALAYADREADFPHKLTGDDLCVSLFRARGFTWGGTWSKVQDYQHFEVPGSVIALWYPTPEP